MVDLEGRLLEANPALCQLSGYSAEELAAIGFGVIADSQGQDEFSRLVAGEISGYVVERRYPHKDGSTVWFRNSISLLHDDHGQPTGAMAIMEDWTAKKQLEERVRQAQKMEALGSLAGGVAHDFNNLLMIINSYASLLKEEFGVDTPMGGKAHAIEEAGTRAAVLTRQLLAFSRKQVLQTMRLSIDELLHSSQQMLRRLIREDIEFITHPGAGEACIEADPGQLQQVLMNLVVNASDAMPNGGRLTIQSSTIELAGDIANGNGKIKPGRYVHALRGRYRHRHERRHPGAHLRALLHHQGTGQGNRPRPGDRLRGHRTKRRPHPGGERPRQGMRRSPSTCLPCLANPNWPAMDPRWMEFPSRSAPTSFW